MKSKKLIVFLAFFGLLQAWAGASDESENGPGVELETVKDLGRIRVSKLEEFNVSIEFQNNFNNLELVEGIFINGVYGEKGDADNFKLLSRESWSNLFNFSTNLKSYFRSYCTVRPLSTGLESEDSRFDEGVYRIIRAWMISPEEDDEKKQFVVLAEKNINEMLYITCTTPKIAKTISDATNGGKSQMEVLLNSFGSEVKFFVKVKE